jgi:uncharacterized protein (DUF1697 family)
VQTLVALLRGVNLGARNKVPMAELRQELSDAGLQDVKTYIQSGNLVFRAADRREAADTIETRIAAKYGHRIAVVTRTLPELRRVAESNPFPRADTSKLHVVFLADTPTRGAKLDPDRSPGDEAVVKGRTVYLHLRGGAASSKFTIAYVEKALGTVGTQRNWNTLLKLVELAGG